MCVPSIDFIQTWDNINNAEILEAIAVLLMLFVSFVLPWFTAFFFEFKVIIYKVRIIYVLWMTTVLHLYVTSLWDYLYTIFVLAFVTCNVDN